MFEYQEILLVLADVGALVVGENIRVDIINFRESDF